MSSITRRELLKRLLGCAAATAGTVVVAESVVAKAQEPTETTDVTPKEPEERADQLAEKFPEPTGDLEATSFVNRAFRNGGGFVNGGFRNGGFVNGGFRNGGFVNGGFRNAAFRNW